MTKAMLIINPSSGQEQGVEYATSFEKVLRESFEKLSKRVTSQAGDARKFAAEACESHFSAVFAIGGDGTLNECVSGLAEYDDRPDFGFLPTGTMNNLARQLGFPMNPEKVIQSFPQMKKIAMDIGKVNDAYFISSVSVGTIPETLQSVEASEKKEDGIAAYLKKAAEVLGESEGYDFRLTLDGEVYELTSSLVIVMNGHGVAGMNHLLPDASLEDGRFNLLAFKGVKMTDKLALLPKAVSGTIDEDENIFHREFQSGRIELRGEESIKSNVDGDEGDALPLELTILPKHLTVFVPS